MRPKQPSQSGAAQPWHAAPSWDGEFPPGADSAPGDAGRREFLKLMGASMALAGASGCGDYDEPPESIVPYVNAPEDVLPGRPTFYATGLTLGGYATGVLAESRSGRPVKIEGNPAHPASLGATDAFAQASLLSLYDPDRSQAALEHGQIGSWERFVKQLRQRLGGERQAAPETASVGLHILTETITSPSIAALLDDVRERFPRAQWHQYEPVNRHRVYEGTKIAFGQMLEPIYDLEAADVILTLDADLLTTGPGAVRYARDFSNRRRVGRETAADNLQAREHGLPAAGLPKLNRLYAVESSPTPTGAMADHRRPLAPGRLQAFVATLARRLANGESDAAKSNWSEGERRLLGMLADDLANHRGRCLVVAGDHLSPDIQAIAHLLNESLGNVGNTVRYTQPVAAQPTDPVESIRQLTRALEKGEVDVLLIVGGNPVYNAPADLEFAAHLEKARFAAHLSLYDDETSALCDWHIPAAHELESWGDARAYDGTVTLQQPLIDPLYNGKTPQELLEACLDGAPRTAEAIVREFWQQEQRPMAGPMTQSDWKSALHTGFLRGSEFSALDAAPAVSLSEMLAAVDQEVPQDEQSPALEIQFLPDPTIWDGRFANNAWLQELPKPLTKLTWDNAALTSHRDARRWNVRNGQVIQLQHQGRSIEAPVWILPGQAERCVTLHLGYGRKRAGRVGDHIGYNAYSLRTTNQLWTATGVSVSATDRRVPLASTQHHYRMEGRDLVRRATLAHFQEHPDFAQHEAGHHHGNHEHAGDLPTLYDGPPHEGDYAWGLTVDLNACTGCNACVIACQAENNIPVVGKHEVMRGREMHWMRIDSYWQGSSDEPELLHQPVLCMHCENAPCEVVCPVAATTHSVEGLNEMTYNRCVGTRYCSNNCPYKVRRFNFYDYSHALPGSESTPVFDLLRNPEVTVRSRGVMEKCTYCVQRIQAGKIAAKKENRRVRDGEIVTACEAVCPTQAITFGDVSDETTRVARRKASPLNYGLLEHTNTRPRTTYLARVTNPYRESDDNG